ncbi:hypothetical protein RSSM_06585 [Rhodopirellula sallentina SM41]|uniref:Uncharacterized protein n=1 Tax=Rhodopirellula sallentina SM41 TaxID=1263870 RepID=M5TRY7_9BACT|nr:hypothetical protein RSSM_06585 [Rhodopirellula sallentina SM41]
MGNGPAERPASTHGRTQNKIQAAKAIGDAVHRNQSAMRRMTYPMFGAANVS